MKYKLLSIFLIFNLFIIQILRADEGMWIPLLLQKYTIADMQKKGFKLNADDIYSINKASLKDAVMIFGGGCTGELISDQGLLITNHHCGYDAIQKHSSLEHDYLTNGFYANTLADELDNPGLSVTFLVRMEDVTDKVLVNVTASMTEKEREAAIDKSIADLIPAASEEGKYKVAIKPFFSGNQYFMFVQKVYTDVRLVLAPPSAIGKFGGDTDNWMWPRHTGDFSVFRIYADANNEPADYSPNNKPYTPIKSFEVSTKGVKEGDFTMVFGYPGRTQEYLTSYAVKMVSEVENPAQIDLRQKRIDIMTKYMNQSALTRIQYSSKYARVSNYWKKWIGEDRGLLRLNAIAQKEQLEAEFQKWADNKENQKVNDYSTILASYKDLYQQLTPINLAVDYIYEAGMAVEIIRWARGFTQLAYAKNDEALNAQKDYLKKSVEAFFKDYNLNIDKETFLAVMKAYATKSPEQYRPDIFAEMQKTYKGDISKWADDFFANSMFANSDKIKAFVDTCTLSSAKLLANDPAFQFMLSLSNCYSDKIDQKFTQLSTVEDSLNRIWMLALQQYMPNKNFYPDANSTLRVSYGKVEGSFPADGVEYTFQTTLDGMIAKDNPEIYDYRVPEKLKELYYTQDYGRWSENGKMPVAFLATNHTTGGNSGSPVLNAYGQLIGVNFDRSWESTMSDIMFDPDQCRNITLDIRFALFIMDKYFGAERLINEINFAE